MPVTKKRGAIFPIYADSPVHSTLATAKSVSVTASATTHNKSMAGSGLLAKANDAREGAISPIKKSGKAVALMSKPRRALQVKSGEMSGAEAGVKGSTTTARSGKATDAKLFTGDENAPSLRLAKSSADNNDQPRKTASVNPKSTAQPLMPRAKSTSSKRLFEVLSGPSSPTRSTTPLPHIVDEQSNSAVAGPSSVSAHAQASLRVTTSSRTGKSPAKKSRAEPGATATVPQSQSITAQASTSLGSARALSTSATTSTKRVAQSKTKSKSKSKLFDIYTDVGADPSVEAAAIQLGVGAVGLPGPAAEDKENADPSTSSTILDSPASRTRSKTRTSLTDGRAADEAVSPSVSRTRVALKAQGQSGTKTARAVESRVLGDVFVLGDVSEAYGAVGTEPEGFKTQRRL